MRTWLQAVSVLIGLLASSVAPAQSVDIVIRGVVTDQTGGVLPGVTVTATNVETGLVRWSTTDGSGHYQVAPLPAGVYTIKADLTGFRPQVRTNQTLHVGTTVTLDFAFETITATEAVTVWSDAPVLETTMNTLSRLVSRTEIDDLPVIDRNFNGLASLAAGVTPTGVYGGVDIGGSRDFQNGYNVDGVSAEDVGAGGQRITYAQDWIQEFQVLTTQYSAEFGRASGGILNVITRSGSNVTTGRAYGFFRNEAWDATPMFAPSKAPLHTTRLGATAGGKLIRDRLFFFGGAEWFDEETSGVVNSSFPESNGSVPVTSDQKVYFAKLESHPNESNTYRIRYNADTRAGTNVGVGGSRTEEHGESLAYNANDITATWTRTLAASSFNELRAAFSNTSSDTRCNFAERNPPGTWFQRGYPGALFGCRNDFGRINSNELQFIDNYSWTRGSHDVKAGVQVSRARSFGNYRFAREGVYTFPRDIPFSLANPESYPFAFIIFEGPTTWDYSRWSWGAFVQDGWRITPDLTLNVGVRYDVDGSYTALNPLVRVGNGLNTVQKDRDNLAPRAGVAWTPFSDGGKTIVRGGVGAYYDENHLNVGRLLLFTSVLPERSTSIDAFREGLNPFWPDTARARRLLAEALARNTTPDLVVPGATPDLENDLQVPLSLQASAGLSRSFEGGVSASADVVIARGSDQYLIRDVNYDRDAALLEHRVIRPNPNYSSINRYGNGGEFRYRAFQAHVGFAPTSGHLMRLSYTLAKIESNTNTALHGSPPGGAMSATNPFDFDEDRGPANHDIRHNLTASWVTTLPFGVQLSGILSARSALPWSVTTPQQLDADPFPDRPEPRNSRRGDGFFSLDARASKTVRLSARWVAAAFVEIYNVTNATNLINYNGTLGAAQFGQPRAALEKRRTQLGFRVTF